jgi:hypothetical protein
MVGQASSPPFGNDGQDARPTGNPRGWRSLRGARNDMEAPYAFPLVTK